MIHSRRDAGVANPWFITSMALIFLCVTALAAAGYFFYNATERKAEVETTVATAVNEAEKVQADKLEAQFLERDKQPNLDFVGPDDYGRLTFSYPKTWSAFVNKDASTGTTFESYLNPASVPPISPTQQYALRVLIEQKDYDKVIAGFDQLVKKGDLKSSSVKIGEENATRLDGAFTKNIRGSAVIFRIRDKTVTIRSDADTFKPDFDALIQTIRFNQ